MPPQDAFASARVSGASWYAARLNSPPSVVLISFDKRLLPALAALILSALRRRRRYQRRAAGVVRPAVPTGVRRPHSLDAAVDRLDSSRTPSCRGLRLLGSSRGSLVSRAAAALASRSPRRTRWLLHDDRAGEYQRSRTREVAPSSGAGPGAARWDIRVLHIHSAAPVRSTRSRGSPFDTGVVGQVRNLRAASGWSGFAGFTSTLAAAPFAILGNRIRRYRRRAVRDRTGRPVAAANDDGVSIGYGPMHRVLRADDAQLDATHQRFLVHRAVEPAPRACRCSAIDARVQAESIVVVVLAQCSDDDGSLRHDRDAHRATGAGRQGTILPVYSSIALNGATVRLCGGRPTGGTYNKLGNGVS